MFTETLATAVAIATITSAEVEAAGTDDADGETFDAVVLGVVVVVGGGGCGSVGGVSRTVDEDDVS